MANLLANAKHLGQRRVPLREICQLKHRVPAALARARWLKLCNDRKLVRRSAQAANVVEGDCGFVYMWDSSTPWKGFGWISEDYGVYDVYGIYAGAAVIHIYKISRSTAWAHDDSIWPNENPYEWRGGSYEYVVTGTVGTWMLEQVEGDLGQICGDPYDQAYSVIYVS
jgi:hypothetical protein